MTLSRRRFLHKAALAGFAGGLRRTPERRPDSLPVVEPPRLKPGDTVGIIAPAGALDDPLAVDEAREAMAALGLRTVVGEHVLDRRGYLAGTDDARAADVMEMFTNPDVDALLAMRGGWGCARILPLLDYALIRDHPKALVGYSDVTALLLAIYARSGLVTFHGPTGVSTWNAFSVDHFRRLLFDGDALVLRNPAGAGEPLGRGVVPVQTITPGSARGRLAGGNLSVLAALVGSGYLPAWDGHILFLEDVAEDLYRIDRMLTQLNLAGVLDRVEGLVFGQCRQCEPGEGLASLTLQEILADHTGPRGLPTWYGSMIGHIGDKFTVPVGVQAEIDAGAGTIRLLEPAVR